MIFKGPTPSPPPKPAAPAPKPAPAPAQKPAAAPASKPASSPAPAFMAAAAKPKVVVDPYTPPPTSLRTERLGDGRANCLEKAVTLAKPGDQVVLFQDRRDSSGHA